MAVGLQFFPHIFGVFAPIFKGYVEKGIIIKLKRSLQKHLESGT